jgi:hypothetical protein
MAASSPAPLKGEAAIQELVARLKLVAKIQPGQKLDLTSMDIFDDTWFTNKIVRSLLHTGESRDATLNWIKHITEQGIELCSKYSSSQVPHERSLGLLVLDALKETEKGFPGLKSTYKGDQLMLSRIDTHQLFLDLKISELEEMYGVKKIPASF